MSQSLAATIAANLQIVQHALSGSEPQTENCFTLRRAAPCSRPAWGFLFYSLFQESWPCELILAPTKCLPFESCHKGTLMSNRDVSAKMAICSIWSYILVEAPSSRGAFFLLSCHIFGESINAEPQKLPFYFAKMLY